MLTQSMHLGSPVIQCCSDNKNRIKFPYEIKSVDTEANKELLKDFTGEKTGFVQVGPLKWFFPSGYAAEAENYYNFQCRPDDVWIVTFPRSGTTWMQEMLWLLANNLDYEAASESLLIDRFPFLEFSAFMHKKTKDEFLKENKHSPENCKMIEHIATPAWKTLRDMKQRRFIKTHLPFSLLPPNILKTGCRIIYLARNPKDVAVSFYHLNRSIRTQGYVGDFPKYWEYFEKNLQPWTPFWEHIKEGWDRRNEENLLFLFYEEMSQMNLRLGMEKISHFLGYHYTKEQLDKLEEHLSIENFRNNKSVNFNVFKSLGIFKSSEENFIRKGKTGTWRDYFTNELNEKADKWIQKHSEKTGIIFPNCTNKM